MKLTNVLRESVDGIWEEYHRHPFITELGEGTLPIEKFRYYMIQDYLYLLDYARVFALGVVKAREEALMRFFARLVSQTLDGEMKIHKLYCERLSITKEELDQAVPTLDNVSYTNYMLWAGNIGGELEILTAILACSWSYLEIGEKLIRKEGAAAHPFYGEWVKGYASKEYAAGNNAILQWINTLGKDAPQEQIKRLQEIFIRCSQYEKLFWDMAYTPDR